MSDLAIRVENLSKQYRIGGPQARYKTVRESLTEALQAPFRRLSSVVRGQSSAASNETLWALKDVSFDACPELSRRVQRGEVVSIPSTTLRTGIGRNGAGKTTLTSTVSPPRVLAVAVQGSRFSPASPSRRGGGAEIHGRVGSLLEACPERSLRVGTGFHPELR